MTIYRFEEHAPRVDATAWVAGSAEVIGNVDLAERCSVWFGAIIRGDGMNSIRVGAGTNIQENAVLHADPGKPLTIGKGVTIGHKVMLHGCTVGDGSLIGIGAVILNNARIGKNCLVGAGALVTEGKQFEDGMLIVGSPAKAIRALTPQEISGLLNTAEHYRDNAKRFREGMLPV